LTSPIDQVIAEAERALASARYVEYYVWDSINRRRRISLRHIMRDDLTFCGLGIPEHTVNRLTAAEVNSQHSDMVCRRCKASASL
jgi:hypothetical protein